MLGFAPIASLPLASLGSAIIPLYVITDPEWVRVPQEVRAMSVEAEARTITMIAELDMVVAPVYKTATAQAKLRKP